MLHFKVEPRCSIFAEPSNCKNSLKSGASRVVAIDRLPQRLDRFPAFRRRSREPVILLVALAEGQDGEMPTVQFCLVEVCHALSLPAVGAVGDPEFCTIHRRRLGREAVAHDVFCHNARPRSRRRISAPRALAQRDVIEIPDRRADDVKHNGLRKLAEVTKNRYRQQSVLVKSADQN